MATKREGGGKKLVLIGGLVVVAAAVLGYFALELPPAGDDAAGTIGAVKKFRAGQIDDADVVLGGDDEAPADAIPYRDLIAEAGTLEAMSGELRAAAELGAKSDTAIARLRAMDASLGARSDALQASTIDAIRGQLRAADQLLAANAGALEAKTLGRLKGELGAMTAAFGTSKTLGQKEMTQAFDRLGAFGQELGKAAQFALGSKDNAIVERLGSMKNALGAKNAMSADKLRAMDNDLNASIQELGAKQLALGAKQFATSVDSLRAYSLAAGKIGVARNELGAAISAFGKGQLGASAMEGVRGKLGASADSLGAAAGAMQQRALGHMEFSLRAKSDYLGRLNAISDALGAVHSLANAGALDRADSGPGGSTHGGVADFGRADAGAAGVQVNQRLRAFSDNLEAKKLAAASDFLGNMKFQLRAANQLLGAQDQLGKSAAFGLADHLGNVKLALGKSSQFSLGAAGQLDQMKRLGAVSNQLEAQAQNALGSSFTKKKTKR